MFSFPMDAGQKFTVVLLAITMIVVGSYDLWAALFRGPNATVSVVILGIARTHPIFSCAIGVLIGHLLWPQYVEKPAGKEPHIVAVSRVPEAPEREIAKIP